MAAHEGFVALGQRIALITLVILSVDNALMLHLNSSPTQQMGQGPVRGCISTASPHTTPLEFENTAE